MAPEQKMDFSPKAPAKGHIKKGTVITSRRTGSFDFDMEVDERGNVDSARTGRWTTKGERTQKGNRSRPGVELRPKPSSHAVDPLNWSRTRKEVAYASILLTVASLAPLKMLLVTVSSVVSTQLNVSYGATTALTGVPLIIGAMAGLVIRVVSQTTGKRGFLLGGTILALVGALWNMHVYGSYAQFMVSRILQGIGWGIFEALGKEVVDDMFFVHERPGRMVMYNLTSITFLWGSPILGGFVSQSAEGYANQIMIINIIQAVSILLLILGVPETSFDRSAENFALPFGVTTTTSVTGPPKTGMKAYFSTLKFRNEHSTRPFSILRFLHPLKALYTPSVLLASALTAPFLAAALGSAHTISLLFSAMPTFLFPARIGYIFILPAAFSLLFYSIASIASYLRCKPPRHLSSSIQSTELGVAGIGLLCSLLGLLAWGLYTVSELEAGEYSDNGVVFSLDVSGLDLSLRKVSLLLGVLVGGATVLSQAGNKYLSASGAGGGTGGAAEKVDAGEMVKAHRVLEEVVVGAWICGMSAWIEGDGTGLMGGLRNVSVVGATVGVVLGSSAAAVLCIRARWIGKMDERVLGRSVDMDEGEDGMGVGNLKRWGTGDSFIS